MKKVVFRATLSSAGKDKDGVQRYAIYIPRRAVKSIGKAIGRKVTVMVLISEDEPIEEILERYLRKKRVYSS